MIFVYLLLMVAVLIGVALIGWFVVGPIIEWIGHKIFALSIKGAEYHHMVKELRGQGQDPST